MARWFPLKIATYNVGDGPDDNKLGDLTMFVLKGAVAILGQEFGDREHLVSLFLAKYPHWRVLWRKGRNKTREAIILYDTRALGTGKMVQFLIRIGYLGPQGAGGDNPGIKALTTGTFVLKQARRRFRLLTTHAVVSAFSTHGAERARRIAAYVKQLTKFFVVVKGSRIPVIGGGDMNATPSNRVLRRLVPKVWSWDGAGPTRGKRDIDLMGHKRNRNLRFVETEIIETDGSRRYGDHRARLNTYEVRGR